MSERKYKIVGIGEILFDQLPSGRKMLGGAPANFAYVSSRLGDEGIVLSRVGDDRTGRGILRRLREKNLSLKNIQIDGEKPTGVVKVSFRDGQPVYEIVEPVAWDFLELTGEWREIARAANAVCFGSLAQRHEIARRAVYEFVGLNEGLKIFDVNLRQNYFSRQTLNASFVLANAVKCNHEELPVIAELFGVAGDDPIDSAENLRRKFDLDLFAVTRGAGGSVLLREGEISEHAGFRVQVADTIGAGDAFTAAMTHGALRGWNLERINEFANRIGAFVAARAGAMPVFAELNGQPSIAQTDDFRRA